MDSNDTIHLDKVCFSQSPRRHTRIVESLVSPVKSLRPEQIESISDQPDNAHQTTDFLDDDSLENDDIRLIYDQDFDVAEEQRFSKKRPTCHELVGRLVQHPQGLEFVVSWPINRIFLSFITIILLRIAAILLWIFFGKNGVLLGAEKSEGHHSAGDRAGGGVLIGVAMFLLASGGIASWLGVS